MNDLQYGELDAVADLLNCMDRELDDQDIKGVLINLCRRVHAIEFRHANRATTDNP